MKTSNILITAAITILLSTLLAYDFILKAEYKTFEKIGLTKYQNINRFKEYTRIAIRNFSNVENRAGNAFGMSVEYGDKEELWVSKRVQGMVTIANTNNNIVVSLTRKGEKELRASWTYDIILITPKLHQVVTRAHAFSEKSKNRYHNYRTTINGFKQDSLNVNAEASTKIQLGDNRFKFVDATVGGASGKGFFYVNPEANIESLRLNVLNKSEVEVSSPDVKIVEHHVSDSAVISLKGKVLSQFKGDIR